MEWLQCKNLRFFSKTKKDKYELSNEKWRNVEQVEKRGTKSCTQRRLKVERYLNLIFWLDLDL